MTFRTEYEVHSLMKEYNYSPKYIASCKKLLDKGALLTSKCLDDKIIQWDYLKGLRAILILLTENDYEIVETMDDMAPYALKKKDEPLYLIYFN